jgi:hypothetical protein
VKPASRRRPWTPTRLVPGDDEPVTADTERQRRYDAAMAGYPKCACGQSLWAPASQARGFCEACLLSRNLTVERDSQ